MGAKKNACMILVGKPEGKRPLGRPRRERIILKAILEKYGGGYTDWIHLAQGKYQWQVLVNTVMKLRVL
jgi:hypothetical protein